MESVVYCFYKITLSKTEFAGTINQRFFNQSEHAYYLSYFITLSLILMFSAVGGGGVKPPSGNLKNVLRSHSNQTH